MLFLLWIACQGSGTDSGVLVTGDSSAGTTDTVDSGPDSGGDTADTLPQSTTLAQHGQVVCEDPTLRETEGPMVLLDHGQEWLAQIPPGRSGYSWGIGVAVDDFDGDGFQDIFLNHTAAPLLFRGTASDELVLDTAAIPMPEAFEDLKGWHPMGVSAADFDGDGDPDLVFGTVTVGTRLWRNDGGVFVDVTDGSGLPTENLVAYSLPVGDLDGDGDLDLFLGHGGPGETPPEPGGLNGVFLNRGDLTFDDVSDRLSEEQRDGYTQVGTLVDMDLDGDVDLYIANHRPDYRANYLMLNDGIGGLTGEPDGGLDLRLQSMGVGLGDLNDDGYPDLLVSGWGEFALLESVGPGIWARSEKLRELIPDRADDQEVAWGNCLADLDNDGDLDVIVGFSPSSGTESVASNPQDQPDGLWLREGEVFLDMSREWGLRQIRSTKGLVVYDHNGDGWLDVLKTADGDQARLWTARCGEASWLEVDLAQSAPNTRAIGARVVVEVGDSTWTRWVTGASTSYVSSPPPRVHVGLGDVETVDRLVVYWPDGTVDSFTDVPARQRVTITRVSR